MTKSERDCKKLVERLVKTLGLVVKRVRVVGWQGYLQLFDRKGGVVYLGVLEIVAHFSCWECALRKMLLSEKFFAPRTMEKIDNPVWKLSKEEAALKLDLLCPEGAKEKRKKRRKGESDGQKAKEGWEDKAAREGAESCRASSHEEQQGAC